MWSKGQNSTFSEYGYVAYQIKWNHKCSNLVANILPAAQTQTPPLTLRVKGLNSTFLEQGHVAYQIEGNHDCSNMVAIFCTQTPPLTLGMGSKFNFFRTWSCCISNLMDSRMQQYGSLGSKGNNSTFQNMFMLLIKQNGITNAATW